jgi:tRNA U38,U39,U40 pseudouridine synthase TruA
VGTGEVQAEETAAILASKLRTARVETAPAHGLCLWKIHYGAIPGLPKPQPV